LDQWQTFVTVVDAGGFSAAAVNLGKSQSTVSYAIARLEEGVGFAVVSQVGRRAQATQAGRALYHQARAVLAQVRRLDTLAADLAAGSEGEIRLVSDAVFPSHSVLAALNRFQRGYKVPRIELFEEILSGGEDLLVRRDVDLAILAHVPPGFLGDYLASVPFVAVVGRHHPLARIKAPVSSEALLEHRQVVVRDSGAYRRRDAGWLEPSARLTVAHFRNSVDALNTGLGFAWLPEPFARAGLADGALVRLALVAGAARSADMYLVFADRDSASPAMLRFAEMLREEAASFMAAALRS
jgi:DNA-binding transcriptional LysR family regulator